MSLAQRLAERAGHAVARRTHRRGFLAGSAMVGSALAVDPRRYLFEPVSAYAAVCRCAGDDCACGSLCCDGFTEFCCTISGENRCPPGSVAAGWWKVDRSDFCGGGPRYYFDCNAECGDCPCGSSGLCSGRCTGTPCGCANGDCRNRRSGCNEFRYGQCNQDTACVGPIICRVVGCIPPWELDDGCSTAALTNEATRFHDAGCLHEPTGVIDDVEVDGDTVRLRGWVIDPATASPVTIEVQRDGATVTTTVAAASRPEVAAIWVGHGAAHGFDVTVPAGGTLCVEARSAIGPATTARIGCVEANGVEGYWLAEADGTVHPFGGAAVSLRAGEQRVGLSGGTTLVDLAMSADGTKLWALDSGGVVHGIGGTRSLGHGGATTLRPGERWTTLVAAPDGRGYWAVTSRGRVIGVGVPSVGNLLSIDLAADVIDGGVTPSGRGLWLLGADGGVFSLGDAPFVGSLPALVPADRLQRPVTGFVAAPGRDGYWLIGGDGGVFAFDAPFRGSLPSVVPVDRLAAPVVGGVAYGNGYLLVGADGGVFTFSDRPFLGSLGGRRLGSPVVALAAYSRTGV